MLNPVETMVYKILTVAGLATFEIYAAIPAGFAFQLSPWVIFLASLVGGLVGVYVAAFLGDRIRAFFSRNKPPKEEKPKTGIIYRIWDKYGVIGLGFLGTMTVGAPVSIAVGVGFQVPLKRLLTWCCIGVFTRCAIFTTIGHFGLKLF
ncbi:small multi-drug export protein [Paraflavitalea speifideaquila]|uniref:small multi-drug export protein n=1 Tax=Paraflavitalea speifideaquila TaxID=3076558 RepID=UPI0028E98095|nr:small multi-drug export protein [Paraflavitalea speifideiaquila]